MRPINKDRAPNRLFANLTRKETIHIDPSESNSWANWRYVSFNVI